MLYIYKHTSPIYMAYFPDKAVVFSSTEAPLKKVGELLGCSKAFGLFNNYSIIEIEEGQLITFDLETNKLCLDSIKIEYRWQGQGAGK